jgi:hypothetical protein
MALWPLLPTSTVPVRNLQESEHFNISFTLSFFHLRVGSLLRTDFSNRIRNSKAPKQTGLSFTIFFSYQFSIQIQKNELKALKITISLFFQQDLLIRHYPNLHKKVRELF